MPSQEQGSIGDCRVFPVYQEWQEEAEESYDFHQSRQSSKTAEQEVRDQLGVDPLTVNKCAPRQNNGTGMEIQTRTKMTYQARSYDENEQATGEALSDLAMFVQDKKNSTHILSQVGRDARICGLGWQDFDVQDGVIVGC